MQFLKAALLAASLIAAPLAAQAQAAKQVPLRDFFKNPEQVGHQISPDGKYLAWAAPYERRMNVFVRPVGGGDATRVTSETARDINGYFWKGDRIVYVKDFGGDENFHVVSVDLKDILYDDDSNLILSHNRRDAKVFDVFRTNVKTGAETLIAQNPGNITSWQTDHDGKLRMAGTTDGVNTSMLYRAKESDEFKPILTTNFKESVSPLFFTFDNKNLYVASNRGRDKSAIFVLDLATAKEGNLLVENSEVDVEKLSYSRKRKVLTSSEWVTWKTQRKFLDKETEAMYADVQAKLPGYEIAFVNANKAEDKYIVASFNDKSRGKRYLYDKATKKLDLLADVSPWLPEGELADMKPIQYKSRDGLLINGYLTLPKGVAPKNLPVVINPHGGPWARDTWRFNPEVQFLANRGLPCCR